MKALGDHIHNGRRASTRAKWKPHGLQRWGEKLRLQSPGSQLLVKLEQLSILCAAKQLLEYPEKCTYSSLQGPVNLAFTPEKWVHAFMPSHAKKDRMDWKGKGHPFSLTLL